VKCYTCDKKYAKNKKSGASKYTWKWIYTFFTCSYFANKYKYKENASLQRQNLKTWQNTMFLTVYKHTYRNHQSISPHPMSRQRVVTVSVARSRIIYLVGRSRNCIKMCAAPQQWSRKNYIFCTKQSVIFGIWRFQLSRGHWYAI
jgi:hypothetical protein